MIREIIPERSKGPRLVKPFASDRARSPLKALVVEASRALARLDAERLEELALCCDALNRELLPEDSEDRACLAREAKEAADEMTVFARVLEATRANLNVMRRLRDLRSGRLEYGEMPGRGWASAEKSHGDN
jgi:hypothetical protein